MRKSWGKSWGHAPPLLPGCNVRSKSHGCCPTGPAGGITCRREAGLTETEVGRPTAARREQQFWYRGSSCSCSCSAACGGARARNRRAASSQRRKAKLKWIVAMLTRSAMRAEVAEEAPRRGVARSSITSTSTAAPSTSTTKEQNGVLQRRPRSARFRWQGQPRDPHDGRRMRKSWGKSWGHAPPLLPGCNVRSKSHACCPTGPAGGITCRRAAGLTETEVGRPAAAQEGATVLASRQLVLVLSRLRRCSCS